MLRFLAATLAFAGLLLAGGVPSDDEVFREFGAGYKTFTGSFAPPVVTAAYEARLKDTGVAPAEAARRLDILRKRMAAMPPELASLHFDRIYGMENPPFRTAASQVLTRAIEGRKPGRALDVAMGQGRNSLAFTILADPNYRKRVLDSLKPGGLPVIEGFGGGPRNQLLEGFGGLRVMLYEDRDDVSDWGMHPMRLARIAAQKD